MKRSVVTRWLLLTVMTAACVGQGFGQATSLAPATGPLKPHPTNPRYFTDGSGKAIYLTGSHTWDNLQDIGHADPPPAFDFDAYLEFLNGHHHNFIRLWRWEEVSYDTRTSKDVEAGVVNGIALHPWKRTGPGNALDGKPRFDLEEFDPGLHRTAPLTNPIRSETRHLRLGHAV